MTKGDKPGNHDETGSSRRVTKGDKPGNHVVTKSVSLRFFPSAEAVWEKTHQRLIKKHPIDPKTC